MALPVSLSGLSTAVACAGPFKRAAGDYDIALIETGAANTTTGASLLRGAGQSVTVGDSSIEFSKIIAKLYRDTAGSISGTIVCEIRSGSATGTLVATSQTKNFSDIPTAIGTDVIFEFSSSVSLSASTQYWFLFVRSITSSDSTFFGCSVNNANPYSGGTFFSQLYNGGWNANSSLDLELRATRTDTLGDAFYFFGRDSGTASALDAYKATDPTSSWAEQTTVSATSTIVMLAGYQVGSVIHLVISGGTGDYRYVTYDMATDAFGSVETIQTGLSIAGQASATPAASIVVRSDGVVVVLYQGATASVMGTARARIRYARRATNGTWTTAVIVDAEGAFDWVNPEAVLGSSDRTHFFFGDPGNSDLKQRVLNSSNALQTETSATVNFGSSISGVSYNDAGTIRVAAITGGSTGASQNDLVYFNSADAPTLNTVDLGSGYTSNWPNRPFSDGVDLYHVYRGSADADLYVRKSTDHGATWGTATNIFTATAGTDGRHAISTDGNIYQRGNDFVIPYVVNDNGTLKYNEHVVRSEAAGGEIDGSASLSFAGSGALAGSGVIEGSASLALAASADLAGVGELVGSAALAFAGSGSLLATYAIDGSADLAFTASGAVIGAGELAGNADLAFAGSGTLEGAGKLAASADLAFTGSANLLGLAPIAGSADLALAGSGTLAGLGDLTAASDLAFTGQGSVTGSGALVGNAALAFAGSATAAVEARLEGSADLVFTGSATLAANGKLASDAFLDFAGSGTLSGLGDLDANSSLALTGSGALLGLGGLDGTASLAFTASGVFGGSGILAGTSEIIFTGAATPVREDALVGTASLMFAASGSLAGSAALIAQTELALTVAATLQGAGALSGASDLVITGSAALSGTGALASDADLAFTASGSLEGTGALAVSAQVAFDADGVLAGTGAISGTAGLSFTGTARPFLENAIVGEASLSFTGSATLTAAGDLVASSDLAFAGSATLSGVGGLQGSAGLSFAGEAAPFLEDALAGNAAIAFAGSGLLAATGAIAANASLSFTAESRLEAIGRLIASSEIVFTARARPVQVGEMSGTALISFFASGTMTARLPRVPTMSRSHPPPDGTRPAQQEFTRHGAQTHRRPGNVAGNARRSQGSSARRP